MAILRTSNYKANYLFLGYFGALEWERERGSETNGKGNLEHIGK